MTAELLERNKKLQDPILSSILSSLESTEFGPRVASTLQALLPRIKVGLVLSRMLQSAPPSLCSC